MCCAITLQPPTAGGIGTPELGDYAYAVENQWFETLLEARTFSPTLTLYVDSTGGKVRVVSAQ